MDNDDKKPTPYSNPIRPSTDDFSIDVPDTVPDDSDEKRKKSISRSKGWKEWKEFAELRKAIYAKQIPGGALYSQMSKDDNAFYSTVGNAVIEEIDALITYMEGLNG